MKLTNQGLEEIEQYADKKRRADILLMVQVLKEIRELKMLYEEHENTGNCCNEVLIQTNF